VTGGWRKLHNEELHISYSSPSIIRMTKNIVFKHPVALIYHLFHTIDFRLQYNLRISVPFPTQNMFRP
jgi:hypothetical protein